ncbi:MAG TPA: NrtA/SsuA/CpmA family ABC transporter substrate-binding protein [Methylomirabilota bacterium]|jgi:ABC-type nitrate/sulfonate/bicarbonate transport system substrate-binding protein|nr:NrtA/SsuA/CpmA family ABC transporter substrate-binding protein [Methylomirabilota bacterium]
MRRILVLAAILVAVATAAAAQSKPLAVRLAIHTSLMGAPDVIAVRQGYFKQEGLEVEWRRFALGKEGRDAMIAGAIDLNATAPTPFIIGLDKGVPYVALGVNSLFCGSNHLVVLKSSDINSVAQLKGKRIGLPKGTITEFIFVSKVAPAHGLKPGDFQIANIPDAKDRVPSLVAKAVDMAALGDPFVSIAEHEGLIRPLEDFCRYDMLPFMLTATTKIVNDNPAAVVAYLRGWLRAVRLLKDEPEKAAQVYLDDLKSLGREVPLPVLDKALRRMKWEPEITPKMDRYLADMAKDMLAATSGDRIRAIPDLAKGVNKDLLKKAMAPR